MRKGVNESNAQFYLRRQPKKVAHTKWIKLVQETIPYQIPPYRQYPMYAAHCYFIPAVHAERRPAIQIHPHKSGQAEPQIPQINKTKLNITKQAKKKRSGKWFGWRN